MTATKRMKLEKLCRQMLETFERLGDDPMARIDARLWHAYFKKKLARL